MSSTRQPPRESCRDRAGVPRCGREAADAEQVDVVRQRDQEALAARDNRGAEAEDRGELGNSRPGRLGRRVRPPVLVELRVALVGERLLVALTHDVDLLGVGGSPASAPARSR